MKSLCWLFSFFLEFFGVGYVLLHILFLKCMCCFLMLGLILVFTDFSALKQGVGVCSSVVLF